MNKIVPFVVACALLASNAVAQAQSASHEAGKNPFAQLFRKPELAKPASILDKPKAARVASAKAMIQADKRTEKSSGGLPSGIASVYGYETGSRTASGNKLKLDALTAAHRTLPFGTRVLVTNKRNGKTVTVVINDRGPFVRGRVIDVTPAAARSLGFSGLTSVSLAVVKPEPKIKEAGL